MGSLWEPYGKGVPFWGAPGNSFELLTNLSLVTFLFFGIAALSLGGPAISTIWSNYSDLTRPHPKWWFGKGNPLISGKSRLVKYGEIV